ncbi:MAG: hypothetical protein MHM6MM_003622 [Cercozoa sp. M6MM]
MHASHASPVASPKQARELKKFKRQAEALQRQLDAANDEKEDLERMQEEWEQEKLSFSQQIQRQQQQLQEQHVQIQSAANELYRAQQGQHDADIVKQRLNKLQRELSTMKQERDSLKTAELSASSRVASMEDKVVWHEKEVAALRSQLAETKNELSRKQGEINRLQSELEAERARNNVSAVEAMRKQHQVLASDADELKSQLIASREAQFSAERRAESETLRADSYAKELEQLKKARDSVVAELEQRRDEASLARAEAASAREESERHRKTAARQVAALDTEHLLLSQADKFEHVRMEHDAKLKEQALQLRAMKRLAAKTRHRLEAVSRSRAALIAQLRRLGKKYDTLRQRVKDVDEQAKVFLVRGSGSGHMSASGSASQKRLVQLRLRLHRSHLKLREFDYASAALFEHCEGLRRHLRAVVATASSSAARCRGGRVAVTMSHERRAAIRALLKKADPSEMKTKLQRSIEDIDLMTLPSLNTATLVMAPEPLPRNSSFVANDTRRNLQKTLSALRSELDDSSIHAATRGDMEALTGMKEERICSPKHYHNTTLNLESNKLNDDVAVELALDLNDDASTTVSDIEASLARFRHSRDAATPKHELKGEYEGNSVLVGRKHRSLGGNHASVLQDAKLRIKALREKHARLYDNATGEPVHE